MDLPAQNNLFASDAEIERLLRELEHFERSGIIEIAVRNPNVSSYMEHWEGRALSAEAEVEKLRGALKPFADFIEGTSDFWDDYRRIGSLNYDFRKLTLGMFRRARAVIARSQG